MKRIDPFELYYFAKNKSNRKIFYVNENMNRFFKVVDTIEFREAVELLYLYNFIEKPSDEVIWGLKYCGFLIKK